MTGTTLLFAGAFNPPTAAHIELADYARQAAGFDRVLFMPSRSDYIKNTQLKDFAFSNEERLRFLKTVAKNRPWMFVSDLEICQTAQPRTYDTLRALDAQGIHCSLLMGSDKLIELETGWLHVPEIAAEFGIICMSREQDDAEQIRKNDPFLSRLGDGLRVIATPDSFRQISSSAVRHNLYELLRLQEETRCMLPPELAELTQQYLKDH